MTAVKEPEDRKPRAAKKSAVAAVNEKILAKNSAEKNALTSEVLADSTDTVHRPDTLPAVIPVVALRRRKKARYTMAIAALADQFGSDDMQRIASDDDKTRPTRSNIRLGAKLTMLAADIEDVLLAVAVNEDDMDDWCVTATDDDILNAWMWYQQEYPMGEAAASPS